MAPDERIRRALLAGLTVTALAAGAGWWRAAAPALGRAGPHPTPSSDAFLEPGFRVDPSGSPVRLRAVVDVQTGRVLDQVVLSGPEADPDAPVVIHEEPGGAARRREVSYQVWRERSRLMPDGAPVTRRANASDGNRFLLTVSCSGAGAVAVGLTGSSDDGTERVLSCGGPTAASVSVVAASGGPLLVRFIALRDQVDLDARLEELG
ncbi:hypothetical protein B0E53_04915 [Micromonospora sp. MH33]|uniref:hypothetical protein n=1 Tax=Micromonospora sp. MH33 TaxID=1945509 RepID=UPI000D14B979|nr:hypothetical protein [Micromonospora sp. MH33]PSK63166.1 hypothetical protein B0E53_04915 [Micromonospora sp. MH33]